MRDVSFRVPGDAYIATPRGYISPAELSSGTEIWVRGVVQDKYYGAITRVPVTGVYEGALQQSAYAWSRANAYPVMSTLTPFAVDGKQVPWHYKEYPHTQLQVPPLFKRLVVLFAFSHVVRIGASRALRFKTVEMSTAAQKTFGEVPSGTRYWLPLDPVLNTGYPAAFLYNGTYPEFYYNFLYNFLHYDVPIWFLDYNRTGYFNKESLLRILPLCDYVLLQPYVRKRGVNFRTKKNRSGQFSGLPITLVRAPKLYQQHVYTIHINFSGTATINVNGIIITNEKS